MVWRRVLLFVGLWLLFECAVSWLATCDQPSDYAAAYGGKQNHCTIFSGPLVSLTKFGLGELLDFLHAYEKPLVAGFTIVLAIFTGTLWWSTNKMWKAGERQMELIERNAAQQSADMQASTAVSRKAADAAIRAAEVAQKSAELSEKSFALFERPYVIPDDVGELFPFSMAGRQSPSGEPIPDTGGLNFRIGNYGKVPAIVHHVSARFAMVELPITKDKLSAPNFLPGQETYDNWSLYNVLSSGEKFQLPQPCRIPLGMQKVEIEFVNGLTRPKVVPQHAFFLSIGIKYEDAATGIIRHAVTLWQFELGRFQRYVDKTYNYEQIM